jgi:hypothetical protein
MQLMDAPMQRMDTRVKETHAAMQQMVTRHARIEASIRATRTRVASIHVGVRRRADPMKSPRRRVCENRVVVAAIR